MYLASGKLVKSKTMKPKRASRKYTEPEDSYENYSYSLLEHKQQGKKKSDSSKNRSKEGSKMTSKHPQNYKGTISRQKFKKRGRAGTE
jgi:hypothetical protein